MAEPGKETREEEATVKRKPGIELVDEGDDRKKIKPGNDPPPLVEENYGKDESEADGENDEDEEDDDDDDYSDEVVDEEDGKHSNGKSVIDTKGKGIMVEEEEEEDKGKGKLKVENGSDDKSTDDDGDLSDDDSDLSDDPLAEVDLDNILPSRTRRRVAEPGDYIVNDLEDDDDSDA